MAQVDVEGKFYKALKNLLRRDKFLIEHDVNERSISHKLAEYLEAQFQGWDVDCEYNRDGLEDTKRLKLDVELPGTTASDTNATTVYPDIIVHHRGTDENFLVVELKKESNPSSPAFDLRKLNAFRRELHYTYAVFVSLQREGKPTCKWV